MYNIDLFILKMADNEVNNTGSIISGIFIFIFTIVWLIASFTGFLMSILCLSYDGSTGAKIAGFLFALFTGPFFWLYYIFRKTYCTNNNYYPQ
jgi:hypothetical protein